MLRPYELDYTALTEAMKKNIDSAYERMVEDSAERRRQVVGADRGDQRRKEQDVAS